MKTLLSAVLLIAVSAWGQSKPATIQQSGAYAYWPPCKAGDKLQHTLTLLSPAHEQNYCLHDPKPHKPKPSVKKWDPVIWDADGNYHCGPGGEGMRHCLAPTGEEWQAHQPKSDPCDGWPCIKPVEGDCFHGNIDHEKQIPCPDKAAVPVEPTKQCDQCEGGIDPVRNKLLSGSSIQCEGWITNNRNEPCNPAGMVRVYASDDSSVVKLSDSEYSRLQQLRASVVEEEKRLAVKYGANPGFEYCSGDLSAMKAAGCFADHYEYKGQFLLIDKGGK